MFTIKPFIIFNFTLVLYFILALALQPIAIGNIDLDDTILLANIGWRVINGLKPVIDFPHLYGGVVAEFVSLSFYIFGVSFRAINFALIIMFGVSITVLGFLSVSRISLARFSLLAVLSAALMLSLVPIEVGRIAVPTIGQSFSYNHFAVILMMALTVYTLVRVDNINLEIASSIVAGIIIVLLTLVKPTFSVFGLAVIAACLVQSRWLSVGIIILSIVIGTIVLDPGLQRILGSWDFLLNSDVGQRATIFYFLKKSMSLIVQQLLSIIIVAALIYMSRSSFLHCKLPIFILACGYGAATLTMNAVPDLMLMPFLVTIGFLIIEATNSSELNEINIFTKLKLSFPIAMAYTFIFPALISAGVALGLSIVNKKSSLFPNLALSDYVVISPLSSLDAFRSKTSETALEDRVQEIIQGKLSPNLERYEYVMLADGLKLLSGIPSLKKYGIVSSGRMFDFSMAYQSKPVANYPSWPTPDLPYFKNNKLLPKEISAVMLTKIETVPGLLNNELTIMMGADFKRCDESEIWVLFLRNKLQSELCSNKY